MSLTLSIIIAIAVFVILIVFDMIHYLLCSFTLFMFYLFAFLVMNMSLLQKIFYPFGILGYMVVKSDLKEKFQTNATRVDLNDMKKGGVVKGLKYHAFSIIIGIIMLGMMFLMSAKKGQILGVAPLAVTGTGFSAWITVQFAPAISLSLGFIENRLFISWLNVLLLGREAFVAVLTLLGPLIILSPLAIFMPVAVACITFGLFHIIAYAVVWKLIWWASLIMFMWIMSYYLTGKDVTAMDTAHGGWNGFLTAKEALSIVT